MVPKEEPFSRRFHRSATSGSLREIAYLFADPRYRFCDARGCCYRRSQWRQPSCGSADRQCEGISGASSVPSSRSASGTHSETSEATEVTQLTNMSDASHNESEGLKSSASTVQQQATPKASLSAVSNASVLRHRLRRLSHRAALLLRGAPRSGRELSPPRRLLLPPPQPRLLSTKLDYATTWVLLTSRLSRRDRRRRAQGSAPRSVRDGHRHAQGEGRRLQAGVCPSQTCQDAHVGHARDRHEHPQLGVPAYAGGCGAFSSRMSHRDSLTASASMSGSSSLRSFSSAAPSSPGAPPPPPPARG